jgi:hypothetical protein
MEGLTKDDYDYFRTQGFEVVKSQSGKYYVRPYPTLNIDREKFLEAKVKAAKCGFAFDMNGNVLGFTKPTTNDNSN